MTVILSNSGHVTGKDEGYDSISSDYFFLLNFVSLVELNSQKTCFLNSKIYDTFLGTKKTFKNCTKPETEVNQKYCRKKSKTSFI